MAPTTPSLEQVLARPEVWRGRHRRRPQGLPTGLSALDHLLHEGGWPRGALSEICGARSGSGELRLLMPGLAQLSASGACLVLIDPPHQPYAPAWLSAGIALQQLLILRTRTPCEQLWAAGQALVRPGTAVLYWPRETPRYAQLRKLQLAASQGHNCGFVFRPPHSLQQPSPAPLRLALCHGDDQGLYLTIHKQRGGKAGQRLLLAQPAWLAASDFPASANTRPSAWPQPGPPSGPRPGPRPAARAQRL